MHMCIFNFDFTTAENNINNVYKLARRVSTRTAGVKMGQMPKPDY